MIKIESPTPEQLTQQGTLNWPIWEKEASRFDWHYDSEEVCYLLAGQVTVYYGDHQQVSFGKGDMVTFPAGLDCIWQIDEEVKKHYQFR